MSLFIPFENVTVIFALPAFFAVMIPADETEMYLPPLVAL